MTFTSGNISENSSNVFTAFHDVTKEHKDLGAADGWVKLVNIYGIGLLGSEVCLGICYIRPTLDT
jgi:hypothetical protein